MMTKEEYEKNINRMWDSVRKNEYEGKTACSGVRCEDCPLWGVCQACSRSVDVLNVYKAIEVVENWAKEHPIVTNADKFHEMFGIEPPRIRSCINFEECENCKYYDGSKCDADNRFWNAEYKGGVDGE